MTECGFPCEKKKPGSSSVQVIHFTKQIDHCVTHVSVKILDFVSVFLGFHCHKLNISLHKFHIYFLTRKTKFVLLLFNKTRPMMLNGKTSNSLKMSLKDVSRHKFFFRSFVRILE